MPRANARAKEQTMATGTAGNDNLTNDPTIGHDTIDALGGNDVITIQQPNDRGQISPESVTVNGGDGVDTLIINGGGAYLEFGASGYDGSVNVRYGGIYQVFWSSIERLELTGALYANANFTLGDEVDILRLSPGFGGRVNTGAGNDQVTVSGSGNSDRIVIDGGAGDDLVDLSGLAYGGGGMGHEALGGDGNDVLRGSGYKDRLDGGAGNDSLSLYQAPAFAKDSQIFDTAVGGAGNDNFFFGAQLTAFDVVTGGAGIDTLVIQGNYAGGLVLSNKVTQIEGISILAGNNTNFGNAGTGSYDYSITTNDANFAAGVRAKINGAALLATEDFTFNGSAETDASFVVYGSRGVDTLTGGFGNDIFFYAEERFSPGDTVNGGPGGYDGLFFRGNYTIDFNAAGYHGLLTSIENITLSSAADERYARGGGTEFDYNIKLADSHLAAGVTLTVSGALLMATETMILDGSLEMNGILNIFGGRAADTLKGGGQGDILHGNLGADQLTGNGGVDIFRYDTTAESTSPARDHILDFTTGTDKIDLSRIDANTIASGNQDFQWIGSSAFSNKAGELRAEQVSGADWLLQGDTDGNGAADFVVLLTLQGPTPLGAAPDFIL
jgi:Ca2+-binding RTX toxin-like protein